MLLKNLTHKINRLILNISWTSVFKTMVNLILPVGCAGCDLPDCVLCDDCASMFKEWHKDPLISVMCGNIYSCSTYVGFVRKSLLCWKDHSNQLLDKPFSYLVSQLMIKVISDYENSRNSYENSYESNCENNCENTDENIIENLIIVPIPSSSKSQRKRGRKHMDPIAKYVSKNLKEYGINARVVKAIKMGKIKVKSVQVKGSRGRSLRTTKGFLVDTRIVPKGCKVILLDDIITTGSTMKNCVEALKDCGITVFACFAIAGVWSKESVLYRL